MDAQRTLFDHDQPGASGADLKEIGMARVDKAVDQAWKDSFDRELLKLAAEHIEFTAEDVLAVVGKPPGGKHMSAVGPRMNAMGRKHVIRKVGYRKAKRASRHEGTVAIWIGTP